MKRLIPLIILSFIFMTYPASTAKAQLGLPFGGIVSFSLPCTCSGNLWVWFTPLYLGGPVSVTGPVTYSPYSTLLFAYYLIGVPGTWHLGSYVPGVESCYMAMPPPLPPCILFPSLGSMTMVGTNRLGF